MQSIRTLARVAPRATSRCLVSSSRRTFLAAPHPLAIRNHVLPIAVRAFSISRCRFDSSSQELAAKLQSELQLESENNDASLAPAEENVKSFLDSGDWQLVDTEGEQNVKLTRKYDDEEIDVVFSIAQFDPTFSEEEDDIDPALLDEQDLDAQTSAASGKAPQSKSGSAASEASAELADVEDESSATQRAFPVVTVVTIRRSSKQDALRIELVAEDSQFTITSIIPISIDAASKTPTPAPRSLTDNHYAPVFEQLDEELQIMAENYLADRGVNEALAIFIPNYVDMKEQQEYLAWLRKVKDFVE